MPFGNDLDKFELETQMKTFKNFVDEKQVRIKEAIKKLFLSEVLKLVQLILLVPTTNTVSEKSRSTLFRYVYIVDLFFKMDIILNHVASNGLEIVFFENFRPLNVKEHAEGLLKSNVIYKIISLCPYVEVSIQRLQF